MAKAIFLLIHLSFISACGEEGSTSGSEAPKVSDNVLSFSNVESSSLDVLYSQAADDFSSPENLTYQLYYFLDEPEVEPTIAEIQTTWTEASDAVAGVSTLKASNLDADTLYSFVVIVRDEEGHGAAYDVATQQTQNTATEGGEETVGIEPELGSPSLTLLGSHSSSEIEIHFPNAELGAILFTDKLKDNDNALLFEVLSGDPSCLNSLKSWNDMVEAVAKFTISDCTGNGTISPYLAAEIAQDGEGRLSLKSVSGATLSIDTISPVNEGWIPSTAIISTPPTTIIVSFSEEILALGVDSLVLSGTCSNLPSVESVEMNDSNARATFSLGASTCNDTQTLEVSIKALDIIDLARNQAVSAPTNAFTIDTSSPSASLGIPSQTKARSSDTVSIGFSYSGASELTETLTANGGGITVSQVSGSTSCTVAVKNYSASGGTIELNSCSGDGVITVHVDATTAMDVAGNTSVQSNESTQIVIDNTVPTLSSAVPANSSTFSSVPTSIDLTFSEAVAMDSSDISFSGTCTVPSIKSISGSDTSDITLNLTGGSCANGQTIIVNINLTTITDLAGNSGNAAQSLTYTASYSKKIFLTYNKYHGNIIDILDNSSTDSGSDTEGLSGIARADYACQTVADNRRPSGGGVYKALIVDGTNRVACSTANCSGGSSEHVDWVLQANKTYVRGSDGSTVIGTANNEGLFTFNLSNNILPSGTQVNPRFWSGLASDWTESDTCNLWTVNGTISATGYSGQRGSAYNGDYQAMSYSGGAACSGSWFLLCVEQ